MLGAPIENKTKAGYYCNKEYPVQLNVFQYGKIPTTQQMISWLREEHQLFCGVDIDENENECSDTNNCSYMFYKFNKCGIFAHTIQHSLHCYTYEQAELAAIDMALDYLEKGE